MELADKQVKLEFISPEKGSGLYEEIKLSMGDERMKTKSRTEELFVLFVVFTLCMTGFVAAGCGGSKSCEKPKLGAYQGVSGISLPGLGGCFSSGEGCGDCSLWSQSCKAMGGSFSDGVDENGQKKAVSFVGIQDVYYVESDSCMGCGTSYSATSCWAGGLKGQGIWVVAASHPTFGSCSLSNMGCGGPGSYILKKVFDVIKDGADIQ